MVKRVSLKESQKARQEFLEIIKKVRLDMNGKYKFCERLNGSAKFNFIVKDSNGEYDLDYRVILTKNSKSPNYPTKPTQIREDFFKSFQNATSILFPKTYNIENSTSVITLIKKMYGKRVWSYDVCIVKEFSANDENNALEYLARNSQSNDKDGGHSYTWCKLGKYNEAYFKFKKMNSEHKRYLIENKIIPLKLEHKKKNEDDNTKKTSEQIFIEIINNSCLQYN